MKNINFQNISQKVQFSNEDCEKRYLKEMNEEYEKDPKAFDFYEEFPVSELKLSANELKNSKRYEEFSKYFYENMVVKTVHPDGSTTNAKYDIPIGILKTINLNNDITGPIETINKILQEEDFYILPKDCETKILGVDFGKGKSYSKEFTIKVDGEEVGKATSFKEPIIKRIFPELIVKGIQQKQSKLNLKEIVVKVDGKEIGKIDENLTEFKDPNQESIYNLSNDYKLLKQQIFSGLGIKEEPEAAAQKENWKPKSSEWDGWIIKDE